MKILKPLYAMICALALPLSFTACEDDVHRDEHGLAVSLAWENRADAGTETGDIRLYIYHKDGALADTRTYPDAASLASGLLPLDEGGYTVVALANLTDDYILNGDAATAEELLLTLGEASCSPVHAFYGAAEISVPGSGKVQTEVALCRALAELAVVIHDAPQGVKLDTEVSNAASGFRPATGVPHDEVERVHFPQTTAEGGTLSTGMMRLMPTAAGEPNSRLRLVLHPAGGGELICNVEAPVMERGKSYTLTLKYDELHPEIHVGDVGVGDWTVGGEIEGGEATE